MLSILLWSRSLAKVVAFWFAVALSAAIAGHAGAEWYALDPSAVEGAAYHMTVLDDGPDVLELLVEVPGLDIAPRSRGDVVTMPGAALVGEIGRPALPSIRRLVQFPSPVARVRVIDIDEARIPGVFPAPQQPLVTDLDPAPSFAMDAPSYASGLWFPASVARLSETARWSGLTVATLVVNPVRANPATGELRVARTMRLRVEFDVPSPAPFVTTPHRRALFEAALLNHALLPDARPPVKNAAPRTLFVVDDAFEDDPALADLVAAHESTESVEVSFVADGAPALSVYDLIESAYEAADPPALESVIIVGDASDTGVPLIAGTQGRYGDAPFGFLDGDDLLADIAIGRFPAADAGALRAMVDKTLLWRNGAVNGDWLSRALLVAHRQGYPEKYTAASEEIRTWPYAYPPPDFITVYGGETATNATLANRLADGAAIVNYRGHGDRESWFGWSAASEDFDREAVDALADNDKPCVLFAIACDNADLTWTEPSFAERWMTHPSGAVAVLGSIYASYTVPNHEFDKFLFRALYDDGLASLGAMANKANADLWAFFQGDETYESYAAKNIEMYVWLGDPTLEIPISPVRGPGDLQAEALSASSIRLTWLDRSDNEDRFVIESAAEGGDWTELDVVAAGSTSYTSDGWTEAERRLFRVRAFSGEDASPYSGVAATATLPSPPDGLTAQVLSSRAVTLTWTDRSSGEDSYRVLRRFAGVGSFDLVAEPAADATAFADEDLEEATAYEYVVEAVSSGGASGVSPVSALTLPEAPSDLAASVESNRVILLWDDRSDGEDGTRIYRRRLEETAFALVAVLGADAEEYLDVVTDGAGEWVYAVSAFNPSGESRAAQDATVTVEAISTDEAFNDDDADSDTDADVGDRDDEEASGCGC